MAYSSINKTDVETVEKEEEGYDPGRLYQSQHVTHTITSEDWQVKVYTKLYAVLAIMSFVLIAINIIQVLLLPHITNWLWIVLFPGVVFLFFIIWAAVIALSNRGAFYTPAADPSAGMKNAWWHFCSLFSVKVPPVRDEDISKRDWPKRFTRAGILLTILFNIVLTEFVYFPVFAVPAFKKTEWALSMNVTRPPIWPTVPAVAVLQIQGIDFPNEAIIPTDDQVWQQVCQNGISTDKLPNRTCVADTAEVATLADGTSIAYAVYHPKEPDTTLQLGVGMDFFYPFNFRSNTGTILTLVAFLDPALADDFPRAWQCGILSYIFLNTFTFQQITLRPTETIDELNAMDRTSPGCDVSQFKRYLTYDMTLADWGNQPDFNLKMWNCDLNNEADYTEPCTALFQIVFPTPVTTVYKSRHGKDWLTILTEEGGIVGFVTFLTWFFGIFEAL